MSNRTDLPPVDSPNFLEKVRETLSVFLGFRGDAMDKAVTYGDLIDSNIAVTTGATSTGITTAVTGTGGTTTNVTNITQVTGDTYTPDYTPPPTPTGFAVTASLDSFIVTCDQQGYTTGNGHQKSRLYGSTAASPVFANAVLLTEFSGSVGAYPSDPNLTWHLWLTWVSVDGVESSSPAGGTNGLTATTGQNVSRMVSAMTGTNLPFKVVSSNTTLPDGSSVSAGTYMSDAYIHNGFIVNAMISNLAVTSAKIANAAIATANIADGAITNAKIADATITSAKIGTAAIGSTAIQDAAIVAGKIGTAAIATANIQDAAITNAKIGNTIQSDDFATGTAGWQLLKSGNFELNAGTFRGTLNVKSAASGARLEIRNNVIMVFDASGVMRVKIGDLSA